MRETWITEFVQQVWESLLPRNARDAALDALASPFRSEIGRALVAVEVCVGDGATRSPDEIARDLLDREMTSVEASQSLVLPVVERYRYDGAPWEQYWDAHGLRLTLAELWVAERRTAADEATVRAECARHLGMRRPENIDVLLTTTLTSVSAPPLDDAEKFPAVAAYLAGDEGAALRAAVADSVMGIPRLESRPDLVGTLTSIRLSATLSELGGPVVEEVERWQTWQLGMLSGLTTHETELLRPLPSDTEYVRRCLAAGRHIYQYDYLLPGSLPSSTDVGKPAPSWMQDDVIGGGYRNWHGHIAPYALWFATAESIEHRDVFRRLVEQGAAHVAGGVEDDHMVLYVLLDEDNPHGALRVPFSYNLASAAETWTLLHLAACGSIRLMLLEMIDDSELTVLGALSLELPPEAKADLEHIAVERLRVMVGDDELLLREAAGWRVSGPDRAPATFEAVDSGKAEELLFDLSPSEGPLGSEGWAAYREARAELARVRSRWVEDLLDGAPLAEAEAAVQHASAVCARRLDVARGGARAASSYDEKLAELARCLPDEHTAFVHLFQKDGHVSAASLVRQEDRPAWGWIDLSHVDLGAVRDGALLWATLANEDAELEGVEAHDVLELLTESMTAVVTPIVEELGALDVRRLVLSPTRPFDMLPLHAAPVFASDRCLLDVFDEVLFAPSLRALGLLSDHAVGERSAPLLVAHAGGRFGTDVLPGPAQEIEALASLYPDARTLSDEAATVSSVLDAAAGRRVVHVAAHGFTDPDRWASGLLLAGPTLGSAALTAARIVSEGDFHATELVVLTACRTGTHDDHRRTLETFRGLDGAFVAAGARAVVSTLWEVGDTTGLVFAVVLHSRLMTGEPLGSAYREAVSYLRDRRETGGFPTAEVLLDRVQPAWRELLDAEGADRLPGWGAFKLTGASW